MRENTDGKSDSVALRMTMLIVKVPGFLERSELLLAYSNLLSSAHLNHNFLHHFIPARCNIWPVCIRWKEYKKRLWCCRLQGSVPNVIRHIFIFIIRFGYLCFYHWQ